MKFAAVLCLVLAASVGAFAEDADVATYGGKKATTAWDIISADSNLSTLKAVVEANGLVAALDDPKRPVTVFGPTNAALAALVAALPAGTPLAGPLVTNILLQHVTRSKVSPFMRVGRSVASLNPGNSITRVASTARGHKASAWRGGQGNTVAATQTLKAKKASVIVIDGVILPNNAFASIQAIAAFYNYTSFAGAVVQAGLLDAANAVSPQKTVFGPNNAAFAAVAGVVATLTPEQVITVLTYHVSPSVVATPFKATPELLTLANQTLALVAPASIVAAASNATVLVTNIYYPGGVFHGINAVLIPKL
uniref:FAS1 domain-containing protein n=1 Tax=Tetradesmus obliquus TaxID=3088 RepID=A0A383VB84_TETOB|eukprot:jgi/Sobl393_1/13701/SZX62825.1